MKYTCLTLFSGLGGGALGFQSAGFELIGGFDNNAEAIEDYRMLTGSPGHCVDLFEAGPTKIRDLVGPRRPDVIFTSPPCVGFSGCLPEKNAKTKRYKKLNSLAELGIFVALEAWEEKPPIILLENVPRIMSRGREWLDAISEMLRSYGYAVTESTHDCGELGQLAQSRRRFLLLARHIEQVPEFIYEPSVHELLGVGEVIGELPIPLPVDDGEDAPGGEMHRLDKLSPLNWLRLALIPAGGDWRDLPEEVAVRQRPGRHNGGFGVEGWDKPCHSVVGYAQVANTRSSIADPRLGCSPRSSVYGVCQWDDSCGTVLASARIDNGCFALADPRVNTNRRYGLGVCGWHESIHAVIGEARVCNTGLSIADERDLAKPTHELLIADGVTLVDGPALDLETTSAEHLVIRALDGTWHRPLTTLELAALQGLPTQVDGEWLQLAGGSKARWRKRIGNAVPPATAEAIARTIWRTLEASQAGILLMGGEPVWVDGEDSDEAVLEEVSP